MISKFLLDKEQDHLEFDISLEKLLLSKNVMELLDNFKISIEKEYRVRFVEIRDVEKYKNWSTYIFAMY